MAAFLANSEPITASLGACSHSMSAYVGKGSIAKLRLCIISRFYNYHELHGIISRFYNYHELHGI
jgi:hypothetical protein